MDYGSSSEANWISALSCVRNSDFFLSGSMDGAVRGWKLERNVPGPDGEKVKKGNAWRLVEGAKIPVPGSVNAITETKNHFLCAVGQEGKHGRWHSFKRSEAKDGVVIITKPRAGAAEEESAE